MKVGALVLYIDNAAGGFTQLVERSSQRNGLVPVVGPLRHVQYEAEALKVQRFGYTSCYQTKVTIILLQKMAHRQNNLNWKILPVPNEPKPPAGNKKLDFVVFDYRQAENQTPLDVNVFSPELNNATVSKCSGKHPGKLVNDLRTSPSKPSNAAIGTVQGFPGTGGNPGFPGNRNPPLGFSGSRNSFQGSPGNQQDANSAAATTPQPNSCLPAFSQAPPTRAPPRKPQPVTTRPPAAAQRYRPVSSAEYDDAPRQVPDDVADDAGCSCCVIS